jgi:hypothetical protein
MPTPEGTFLDVAAALWNGNKAEVLPIIMTAEGGIENAITQVLANVRPTGIAGIVWPYIKGSLGSYVAQLVAQHTPEELYDLVGAWLSAEAKAQDG